MKKRRYEKTSHPGIYLIKVLNDSGRWTPPKRGNKYCATKSVRSASGGTRKLRKHFRTFRDAQDFRQSGSKLEARKVEMTFADLVNAWKELWLPTKQPATQVRYLSYLRHMEFFNRMLVAEISASTIDAWAVHVTSKEYLAQFHSTRLDYGHEYTALRAILGFYASRFDRDYRLPFLKEHREMLIVKSKPKVSKDLTLAEFKAFLDALWREVKGTRWEVIYYLACTQYGIYGRVQEAAALHFEDVDFERRAVLIQRKVVWARVKGQVTEVVDGTKANGGKQIPLSAFARKIIHEWIMKSAIRSGLLFTMGGRPLEYRQIEYRYSRALKNAGLKFTATHILRHASLTEFYASSKCLLQTARVAGHGDVRSTEKYAKVRDESVRQSQLEMDEKVTNALGDSL